MQTETMQPKWLAGVWPGAEIVTVFLDMFDSLRDENHRNLADCIKAATGAADLPSHVQPAVVLHLPVLLRRACVSGGHCQSPLWLALWARLCSCPSSGTGYSGKRGHVHLHMSSQPMEAIRPHCREPGALVEGRELSRHGLACRSCLCSGTGCLCKLCLLPLCLCQVGAQGSTWFMVAGHMQLLLILWRQVR